jgi:hypothetical protein
MSSLVMNRSCSPLLILTSLALLIPVNIFYGTGWLRGGIQWGLVQYQQTVVSDHLLSFTAALCSVASGALSGSDAWSTLIWGIAVIFLISALILNIAGIYRTEPHCQKAAAGFTIAGGLGFLLADIIRYGFFLHGSDGWCIPVGIPAILVLGIRGCCTDFEADDGTGEPSGYSEEKLETVSWYCRMGNLMRNQDIVILVIISLLVKAVVFFSGILPNMPFTTLTGDLTLYHWYATSPFHGIYPYVSYYVPYPQLFLVPVYLALIPVITLQNPVWYLVSFSALMILVDTATLICLYSLACRFFGREKAFLCGLLYATAIAAAFLVPISYDAVPTFFLVFSIWLLLSQKTVASYLSATAATLLKWFPAFCFPFYLVYSHKNGHDMGTVKKSLVCSALFAGVIIVPFLLLNASGFFNTYLSHVTRTPEVHSFVYYLDAVSRFLFQGAPSDFWFFVLLALGELALFFWYFKNLDKEPLTLVYVIFFSVFFFVLTNKVFSASYIIWLTPFLSLLLVHSSRRILLFYLAQVIIYLETPVLFGIVYGPQTFGLFPDTVYSVFNTAAPSFPFIFYTLKFGILFAIFWVCISDLRKNCSTSKAGNHPPVD